MANFIASLRPAVNMARKRRLAFLEVVTYPIALMKSVTATEAKRYFSRLLKLVSSGETIAITKRGRRVATFNPVQVEAGRVEAFKRHHLAKLRKQPLLGAFRGIRDELY